MTLTEKKALNILQFLHKTLRKNSHIIQFLFAILQGSRKNIFVLGLVMKTLKNLIFKTQN